MFLPSIIVSAEIQTLRNKDLKRKSPGASVAAPLHPQDRQLRLHPAYWGQVYQSSRFRHIDEYHRAGQVQIHLESHRLHR